MKKHILDVVLILLAFIVFGWATFHAYKEKPNTNYVLDLPEEISQADDTDTMYCIKRHDTLFIQFK
jgi:hypothetical protein